MFHLTCIGKVGILLLDWLKQIHGMLQALVTFVRQLLLYPASNLQSRLRVLTEHSPELEAFPPRL